MYDDIPLNRTFSINFIKISFFEISQTVQHKGQKIKYIGCIRGENCYIILAKWGRHQDLQRFHSYSALKHIVVKKHCQPNLNDICGIKSAGKSKSIILRLKKDLS